MTTALYEHEYGLPVPENALAVIDANLARCFQNLASQTEFLAALRAGHEHEAERQLSFHLAFGLPTCRLRCKSEPVAERALR